MKFSNTKTGTKQSFLRIRIPYNTHSRKSITLQILKLTFGNSNRPYIAKSKKVWTGRPRSPTKTTTPKLRSEMHSNTTLYHHKARVNIPSPFSSAHFLLATKLSCAAMPLLQRPAVKPFVSGGGREDGEGGSWEEIILEGKKLLSDRKWGSGFWLMFTNTRYIRYEREKSKERVQREIWEAEHMVDISV